MSGDGSGAARTWTEVDRATTRTRTVLLRVENMARVCVCVVRKRKWGRVRWKEKKEERRKRREDVVDGEEGVGNRAKAL